MTMEHPDFQMEQQRLTKTVHYMDEILQSSKTDIENAQTNIKTAMSNAEYLDSSDSFLNI